MTPFDDLPGEWVARELPDGMIVCKLWQTYTGLQGQPRVAYVDRLGRVYHYDLTVV